jgi:PAS domain S-box-containing protein
LREINRLNGKNPMGIVGTYTQDAEGWSGLMRYVLLIPADWLQATMVIALISVLMVVGLFSYLNLFTRRIYFRLWTAGWLFYAVYLAASLGLQESPDTPWLVLVRRACIGISALFMFWGAFELSNAGRTRTELGGGIVLMLVWSYIAAYRVQHVLWITVPVFVLLCWGGIYSGISYISQRRAYHGASVLGTGFILWGVHLLAFPFLGNSDWLWANVHVFGSACALMITVGMLVERSMHVSEHYYRELFNSAGDAIFLLDAKNLRIVESNPAASQLTGIPANELTGKKFLELSDDLKQGLCGVITSASLETLVNNPRLQFTVNRPDGTAVVCEGRAANTGCFRGPVLQLNVRDVTERKLQEQSLRDTADQLEKAMQDLQRTEHHVIQHERLNALTKMASGVAHDFNNALAKILGFNELLLSVPDNINNPEKVRKYLHMINTAAQDAVGVVNRLREFYRHRKDTEVYGPVDTQQVIEQAIIMTQPKWKDQMMAQGATIWMDVDLKEGLLIRGNASELREVMINLIFNATDAMPKGGMLTIHSRLEYDVVVLEITDTGVGMSSEVRRRCLEPFYSTKGDGFNGLGLAIVYGILNRHAGTIKILSEEGKGTTVSIRLPVHIEAPVAAGANGTGSAGAKKVLLVEDEPLIRDIQAEYLRADGHDVETAVNGSDALDKFHSSRFDVVITDRAMPEMNGDQLISSIRLLEPETPIILVTGFGDMMDRESDGSGPDLILSKPVTQHKLQQAIYQVLQNRSQKHEGSERPRNLVAA